MTFSVNTNEVRKLREEQQIGLNQAMRILKKKEALRRIDSMRPFGFPTKLTDFLEDLVEELM